MNEVIKKRIDKIKSGEVPKGYERTRAGIAPTCWNVKPSKNLFSNHIDKNHNGDLTVLSASQERGIIPRGQMNIDIKYNSENLKTYKKVQPGDFVISLRSFQGGIEYSEYLGLVSPAYTVLKSRPEVFSRFYRYYFKTVDFISRLNSTIYGIRDGKQIGYEDFSTLLLHNPPISEQDKIAEILSTWDKAVELKEKLIEEKKRQKKWLATRFFQSKETKNFISLGSVCKITMGQSPSSRNYNCACKGKPLIQGNADINKRKANPRIWTTELTKECKPGDLLLSVRAPVGMVSKTDMSACIGRGICAITAKIEPEYIYQYLLFYENKWSSISQGSTFDAINRNNIKQLIIPIPKEKNKIELIANILSTADREIDLLEQELEQLQKQKKALMQLLLTGIVRVNCNST